MSVLPRIMVAPNGARLGKTDHPALPVTIAEIVDTARACQAAGADGIHAHVRDAGGQHVLDAGLYRELLAELLAAVPAMFTQITTEAVGRYSPAEQRAVVRDVQPRAVSVALREMLAEGETAEARAFYHEATESGIDVQHILYDTADVTRLGQLLTSGFVAAGAQTQALIVLGRYSTAKLATPAELAEPLVALRQIAQPIDWAVCAFGRHESDCLLAAARAGGKTRIGFENNTQAEDGSPARDNAQRVAEFSSRLTSEIPVV